MPRDESTREIWVLGATGRVGRAVAAHVAATGGAVTLVGRDRERLDQVAAGLGNAARIVAAASREEMASEIARRRPAVVINTIGPFTETTVPIARACLSGSHYVDLANDVVSVSGLLGLHEEALAAGRTFVTGAGFGVLATESVVVKLYQDRPVPDRVRVDAVASVALEEGMIGEALAATIVDGLPHGGRRYTNGRLVRSRVGSEVVNLTLPDGATATSASIPSGDLVAAQRASGGSDVVAGSSELPTGPAIRVILPIATALLSLAPMRAFARRRLARVQTSPRPRPRQYSWGHADVHWPDGISRQGWLRTGDAQMFTAGVAVVVARRLVHGDTRPGAHTPAAAFGADVAIEAGGTFMLD